MNNTRSFPISEGFSWFFFHLLPVVENTDPEVAIEEGEDDQEDDTKPCEVQDNDRDP